MLNQITVFENAHYDHVACEHSSSFNEEYNLRTYVRRNYNKFIW